jgi:hypothetical protein
MLASASKPRIVELVKHLRMGYCIVAIGAVLPVCPGCPVG